MTDLTAKQSQVLRFLSNQSRQGRSPTVREISDHFGIKSPNGAVNHLLALEKKGKIRLSRDGKSRGIHVVGQTRYRSEVERQLYDALQHCVAFIQANARGEQCLPNEYRKCMDQAYEAFNASDDTESEGQPKEADAGSV